MALTEENLLDFVRSKMNSEDVDRDTPLFSTGNLDSVNQLNLILFLEEQSGVTVGQADVTLDNFDSVGRILDYVSRVAAH